MVETFGWWNRGQPVMKNLEIVYSLGGKRFLFAVEMSMDKNDYQKYEDLREEIWKEPTDRMAGERNMLCQNYFNRGSSLFTGVFIEDEAGQFPRDGSHLVGFSYGFIGVKDQELGFRLPENLLFYSQYLGVKKGFQSLGLGVRIKEFQKRIVMDVYGIDTITCTYDPLVGVNAYRNIHRFGMDVLEYKKSYYQDFGGELNRPDVPSDRLNVSWDLRKKVRKPPYVLDDLVDTDHLAVSSQLREFPGHSGSVEMEVVKEVRLDLDQRFVLVEIPLDFYRMIKETDVADKNIRRIPLQWRMKTREVFQELLRRNFKIVDFRIYEDKGRKRNFYVLKKTGPEKENALNL
jgi:predicted GNAT superfamily acetyltransferase